MTLTEEQKDALASAIKRAWHPTRRIQPKDGAPYVVIAIDPIAQAELLVALAALTDALERECGGVA